MDKTEFEEMRELLADLEIRDQIEYDNTVMIKRLNEYNKKFVKLQKIVKYMDESGYLECNLFDNSIYEDFYENRGQLFSLLEINEP